MTPSQIELGVPRKPEPQDQSKEQVKPFNVLEFLKEVRGEFIKISWPSKEQTTREFFSVILLVAVITSIIFLLDKVFGFIANLFMGRIY
ncbi:MAG: preprotein translocase subunit SecE [Candidatus Melainabacteria bacterium RIFCSPHIGHO2_02_FULL_34_12]|nr:MAG: preprotein translocase subunit SecE [Candidatus Melainabacteria bacterium RIFCSPHIGHO2_02_FULL_34_12]